jgi:two-component system nitrogen regulation sensor histidine kinase GlnL
MPEQAFSGLELLATAVIALDEHLAVQYLNPAAETLFEVGQKGILGHPFLDLFVQTDELAAKLHQAMRSGWGFSEQELVLSRAGLESRALNCIATPVEAGAVRLVIELRPIEQQLRIEREEQQLTQHMANRELIRNLAHEIKNPLGGLRGSAQLLERELDRADLREYTQVIIKEADRLQALMDRLLTPHRPPHIGPVNIHEVCERVRSLILAEFPNGIRIRRNYDTSLPEIQGDREQLIQMILNIARNAAQAISAQPATWPQLSGAGTIEFRTRVVRQVTLVRKRYRLALELQVIDDGPGIPQEIRDRVFYPLVSGREGGTGLGLTLAQTFVQHHHGVIEVDSQPGRTSFRIVLPLP